MILQNPATIRENLSGSKVQADPAIRILFVTSSPSESEGELLDLYARMTDCEYDTVVFVEHRKVATDKKIPMPTISRIVSAFGEVEVNDALRNEFCDEDDDFYIDDAAWSEDMDMLAHLPYLMASIKPFRVVSVPICDDDPAIVRELSYVLSEIMGGRSYLLVVSCSHTGPAEEAISLRKMVSDRNFSNLMNSLNGGEIQVKGHAAFIAGLLVADAWELEVDFTGKHNGILGFAKLTSG